MAAPTSKRSSCISPAKPKFSWRRRNELPAVLVVGARLGNAVALPLSLAQLVAAHPRASLLADLADADLGLHEPVPLCQQQLRLPRLWGAPCRGHVVGRAVPRPARLVDVVSRGDVGAQSRAPLCHPVASL